MTSPSVAFLERWCSLAPAGPVTCGTLFTCVTRISVWARGCRACKTRCGVGRTRKTQPAISTRKRKPTNARSKAGCAGYAWTRLYSFGGLNSFTMFLFMFGVLCVLRPQRRRPRLRDVLSGTCRSFWRAQWARWDIISFWRLVWPPSSAPSWSAWTGTHEYGPILSAPPFRLGLHLTKPNCTFLCGPLYGHRHGQHVVF